MKTLIISFSRVILIKYVQIVFPFVMFAQSCEHNQVINQLHTPSSEITGMIFYFETIQENAPGSDNWPITWAADDNQYVSWGDGGGFGGTNSLGRVSLGIGRVEGNKESYNGFNVWGGHNSTSQAQFEGKCHGIISIGGTLWMWRTGDGSENSATNFQELYKSTNYGVSWEFANVRFDNGDFGSFPKFYAVTFCQFGKDYNGARDNFVYMYAPETFNNTWDVQFPGRITLMRVLKENLGSKSLYSFFAGFDGNNNPVWTENINQRMPVFEDVQNGVMRTSVSFNDGLKRYLLITQQVSRWKSNNGHIGIYEAPEPWGPWSTVLFANAWDIGLQTGEKTVYWNFSNKWASAENDGFVMVMTGLGEDNWGTIEGKFITGSVGINDINPENSIDEINLFQNYPNPFNPITMIRFSINSSAIVEVNIFDALGNKIKEMYNGFVNKNEIKEIKFNAENIASGTYLCEVLIHGVKELRKINKMVLLR